MQSAHDEGDGLLSRADLELELARLVIATERRRDAQGRAEPPDARFVAWFEAKSIDVLSRIAPDLRPFALERLQQIAATCGELRVTELEVDPSTLSFSPEADAADAVDDPGASGRAERREPRDHAR